MKSIYTALFCVFSFSLFAQNPAEKNLYAQMLNINAQWEYRKTDCPAGTQFFASDIDAIQAHLYLVCESLLKNTPKHLNEKQLAKRLHLIEVLHDYADKKIFPTNLYHSKRTPYFVDDFGVHCAVGYLMSESGYTDLVATIRANENYAYIAEIKTPGVAEWAEQHGFDVEELKWIQPAYIPPAHNISPIGNGTNGEVIKVFNSGGLIIAGSFDTLDFQPCLNIGRYQDGQFSCLGDGLDGVINYISSGPSGNFMVYGQFIHQGQFYTMATWSADGWEYINIPTREGAIASAGFFNIGQNLEVAIYHPSNENIQEIWDRTAPDTWQKRLEINGHINHITFSHIGRVYSGKFNAGIRFDGQGEILDTVISKNVIFRQFTANNDWNAIVGEHLSDEVKFAFSIEGQIFFAGSASNVESSSSGILLSRYMNSVLQPILLASSFWNNDNPSINSISMDINGRLVLGGNFIFAPSVGTLAKNLAYYDLIYNSMISIAYLDKPVNSLAYLGSAIYFGGDFTLNNNSNSINRVGRIGPHLGIDNESQENNVAIYPNPFTDFIKVQGIDIQSDFRILDTHGRIVHQGTIHGESTIDLRNLSPGVYMLHLTSDSGNVVRRIVKQ